MKTVRRFPHRNAGHLVDHEGGALDVISLPVVRCVRMDEYRPFLSYFEEGVEWAEDSPELIEAAKKDSGFRKVLVSRLRNNLWFVRNHRTVCVQTVLDNVREYAAHEALLKLAGVRREVCALLVEFFAGGCSCKGDCRSVDFDPLHPEGAIVCDYLFRRLHSRLVVGYGSV
jgi:hypothetical protein